MALQPGDIAPPFTGVTQKGETISLADFAGQIVVLYFYPKDDTPGCTKEACSLRDGYAELQERGAVVLGVSPDSVASHQGFVEKHTLPFNLIADENHIIIDAYGASRAKWFGPLGIRRNTYLIGADGRILHVFRKVLTRTHARQILNELTTFRGSC
jgi:thioredoxin-dependent peroxiredoxin